MIIGVDFDGTCVTHEFPKIGKDIGAVPVLKDLVEAGHQLILFTMRSDVSDPRKNGTDEILEISGNYLSEAVAWFAENDIPLFGVNENPEQHTWTSSPKPYCQVYIDDAALGCPLVINGSIASRPFVNWTKVRYILEKSGVLK